MTAPARRSLARILVGGLVALQALLLLPGSAGAADDFRLDLAGKRDYVAQTNFVQCVGASMQMMLNIIGDTNDRSAATQASLQNLARTLSGPNRVGRQRQGASVRGWAGGLNQLDAGPYRLVGTTTLEEALRLSAEAIRQTGKPVGLLVWRGRHAWVMSGFHATADPRTSDDFVVTAAIVMDPLYPHGSAAWGPSPSPRQALSPKQLGRQFVARRGFSTPSGSAPGGSLMSGLAGKYVLVLPYEAIPAVRLFHVAV
jgi:hypothetical protein